MCAAGARLHSPALPLQRSHRRSGAGEKPTKSTVRSKVEHVFGVMKLKFGFVKVRYRGLAKNANRLFATCALVNLFLVRKRLLYWAA